MLQIFHKGFRWGRRTLLNSGSRGKVLGINRKGQTAIILIILLAVGLILYAASLNMGRLTSTKIYTLKASELAAATLASYMASYGEKLFQETLGGREEYCGMTGAFSAFLLIIILIVIIVVTVVSCGAGGLSAPILFGVTGAMIVTSAVIGIIAAAVSLAINVMYIDPTITERWNEMMANLGTSGNFLEAGIQIALQTAITDSAKIPDLFDYDSDGIFGDLEDLSDSTSAPDYLNRFSFFNTLRLLRPDKPPSSDKSIENFIKGLDNFVYVDSSQPTEDGWGLTDPLDCSRKTIPIFCPQNSAPGNNTTLPASNDPCCQPQFQMRDRLRCSFYCKDGTIWQGCMVPGCDCNTINYTFACGGAGIDGMMTLAPKCCFAAGVDQCGDPDTCKDRTPYSKPSGPDPVGGYATTDITYPYYPWIYQPYGENPTNNTAAFGSTQNIISFREKVGMDDAHIIYSVDRANPDWELFPGAHPTIAPPGVNSNRQKHDATFPGINRNNAGNVSDLMRKYFINDTSNFYSGDLKKGIYPFFYKMQDWFVNLNETTYDGVGNFGAAHRPEECYWCDYTSAGSPYAVRCPEMTAPIPEERYRPLTLRKLTLPLVPAASPYSGGWCVDRINSGAAGDPPQVSDRIPTLTSLFMNAAQCQSFINDLSFGGWRRGVDKFCAKTDAVNKPNPGYSEGCVQNRNGWHMCSESGSCPLGPASPSTTVCRDCECNDAGVIKGLFTDDRLDEVIEGIPFFYSWARTFLSMRNRTDWLMATIPDWYPEVAEWIEPPCSCACNAPAPGTTVGDCRKNCATATCDSPTAPVGTADCCPGSFTKFRRPGTLYIWRDTLRNFFTPINNWLTNASSLSDNVWCVPTAGSVADNDASASEAATFTTGVRGGIDSVIACLRWNTENQAVDLSGAPIQIDDPLSPGTPIPARGNYLKFQGCHAAISQLGMPGANPLDVCVSLPRTLVPDNALGVGKSVFQIRRNISLDTRNYLQLQTCLGDLGPGNENQCQVSCAPAGHTFYDVNFAVLPALDIPLALADWIAPVWGWTNQRDIDQSVTPLNPGEAEVPGTCGNIIGHIGDMNWCTFGIWDITNTATNSCTNAGNVFGLKVQNAIAKAQARFSSLDSLNVLQSSATSSRNQIAKFAQRAEFLEGRRAEALEARTVFGDAIQHFTEFIDGGTPFNETENSLNAPAEQLIWYRQHWTALDALPSVAIYVWQDPPVLAGRVGADGEMTSCGYSHVVKVDAKIPGRCNYSCGDDEWPSVYTEMKSMFERCYELTHREAIVKARVIRWDEPMGAAAMKFPNGRTIWSAKMEHPGSGETGVGSLGYVFTACQEFFPKVLRKTNWGCAPSSETGAPACPQNPTDGGLGSCLNPRYFGEALMINRSPEYLRWIALPEEAVLLANVTSLQLQKTNTEATIASLEAAIADPMTDPATIPQLQTDLATAQALLATIITQLETAEKDLSFKISEGKFIECWEAIHAILKRGVVSEACARYYFADQGSYGNKGFKLKFEPCDVTNW